MKVTPGRSLFAGLITLACALIGSLTAAQGSGGQGRDGRGGAAPPGQAQDRGADRAETRDYSAVQIITTKITDRFYTLEPDRPTKVRLGILTGPDGILLVDSSFPQLTEKLQAAVRKISNQPIRFMVNTHVSPDHVTGNAHWLQLNPGLVILASPQLRDRMRTPGSYGYVAGGAYPLVTFTGKVTFHMNGNDVELIPLPPAHTDGDVLIRFPQEDVIMPGDVIRTVGYPNIHGWVNGMIDALGIALGLCGPNTKVIQGHGPITTRAGIVAHRDMVIAVRDRVTKMISEGKTLEQVIAAHPTADFDATVLKDGTEWYGNNEPFYKNADGFLRQVYTDLSRSPADRMAPVMMR